MKKNNFVVILFAIILLCSCNGSSPSLNHMALNNVTYVDKFENSFLLKNDSAISDIDVIGVQNICIYDSLMLLATRNGDQLWSFVSLPELKVVGTALRRGQGPQEFNRDPDVDYNTSIIKENNQIFAFIYDSSKGRILKLNITETIRKGKTDIVEMKDTLPVSLFNFVFINESKILCKEVNDKVTQQIRYIYENKKRVANPILKRLNKAEIKQGEDINILSTLTKYNPKHNLIVEMPIGLNYINMYSINGSFAKTVCIGKELFDINKIQKKKGWERIYTFADLRLYDHFFGVLYINESKKVFQTKRLTFPTVLLFDWSGNPLASLKLHQIATSFDIDVKNGTLYTYDFDTEKFYKYDISDILTKLLK